MDEYIKNVCPDPLLRDYILKYTFVDFPLDQAAAMEFLVLPSSSTRMILFLGEPSLYYQNNTFQPVEKYSLTGFVSRPHLFIPNKRLVQVMIHFTPLGIQPFIDFPIAEITDQRVDLHLIFKNDFERLIEELNYDISVRGKTLILNRFFIAHLKKAKPIDTNAKKLVSIILETKGRYKLKHICKDEYIGERTAQRLMHNAVGVNFKFFQRMVRLGFVRKLMGEKPTALSDVAYKAGYFDQAHFIHDFNQAFGENPSTYLQRQSKLIWNKVSSSI